MEKLQLIYEKVEKTLDETRLPMRSKFTVSKKWKYLFWTLKKTNLQLELVCGVGIKVLKNVVGYNFVVQMEF